MISAKRQEKNSLGGAGSGNWYRFDKKTTTDECHSVDVRYLYREGLLTPGHWFSLRWSRAGRETGSIGGTVIGDEKPEQVILTYRHRSGPGREWEEVQERVHLSWTACNFGGERPWFVCPGAGCGRRVAVLYGPGRYFLCRHCYDLVYESQRENEMHRALRRAQAIRERFGGSANMTKPFPGKPKGIHHDTYMRMFWEHHEAHMEQIIDALEASKGMISPAARRLGCSRDTIRSYLKEYTAIAQAKADMREAVTDEVELSLYEAIKRGEAWAVCFYLKTQAKNRGYVEKAEVSGPGGTPISIKLVYD